MVLEEIPDIPEIENMLVTSLHDMEDPVSETGLGSEMTEVESEKQSLHPSETDLENTAAVAVTLGKFIHVLETETEIEMHDICCFALSLFFILIFCFKCSENQFR